MKSKLLAIVVTATFTIILGITSCVHEPIEPIGSIIDSTAIDTTTTDTTITDTTTNDTVVQGIPCDPDSVYFNQQILPFLVSSCGMEGCHSSTSNNKGVIIASYLTVRNTADVSPGDPNGSELYEVITSTNPDKVMPPPPANALSAEQIGLIRKWIEQGAKNLACDDSTGQGPCDTTNVLFSGFVKPLVNAQCVGCHNNSSQSGNVNLEGYTNVKLAVDNGSLLGTIKHLSGYPAMPQSQNKMSDCNIAKIEAWINAGALDN